MSALVRVTGRVEQTKFKEYVKLALQGSSTTVRVNLNGMFCPADVNDIFSAVCIETQPGILTCQAAPYVEVPVDRVSIIEAMQRAFRGKGNIWKVTKTYEALERMGSVQDQLNDLSTKYKEGKVDGSCLPNGILSREDGDKLLKWWYKSRTLRRLYLFGLTNRDIKACRMSGDEIYSRCKTNPFTIPSLSEEKCIDICNRQDKPFTQDQVICGRILRHVFKNLVDRKWVGTPYSNLYKEFGQAWPTYLKQLEEQYSMIDEFKTLYLKYPYQVEKSVVGILDRQRNADVMEMETWQELIPVLSPLKDSQGNDMTPTDDQFFAIKGAMNSRISIINGSAGTGKSSCIAYLVRELELIDRIYILCSFTGKAVARLKQVTGRKAQTIHRLINSKTLPNMPKFNEVEPVKESSLHSARPVVHVIIDEISMVTTELFNELDMTLQKNNVSVFYTFVGDHNQLPPITWGCLFDNVLKASVIPVYPLYVNHRVYQVSGEIDGITLNGTNIINYTKGNPLPFSFVNTTNFRTIDADESFIKTMIESFHKQGCDKRDIVVLSPFNKGLDGINQAFQSVYTSMNPSTVDSLGKRYYIGDLVMMLENVQELDIFNGEIGEITGFDLTALQVKFDSGTFNFKLQRPQQEIEADEDGVSQVFDQEDLTTALLTLAFAMTVHKSQGSEWNIGIPWIPDVGKEMAFLNKNLIYPMITRFKRCEFLVGSVDTAIKACMRDAPYRHDNMVKRLLATLPVINQTGPKPHDSSIDFPMTDEEPIFFD